MNQQLLPEPQHSIHTLQWLYKIHVTIFIKHNIIVLSVSFTAEIVLCTVEMQLQLF
jgi:hypothetical protein